MKKRKRPGVMVYFETKHCIQRLNLEEVGQLFLAILDYAENGITPTFSEENSLSLCIAWDVVKPKIDADNERYLEVCEKRKKAASDRWEKDN